MTDIKPGDLVVCVDDSPGWCTRRPPPFKRGHVCEVLCVRSGPETGQPQLVLDIDPKPNSAWNARRFRLINDNDMDIFRDLVADLPKELVS